MSGTSNDDRTGVGTLSIFGSMLKYNLRDTFPLCTTKRMFFRAIFEELMFYLSGKTDNKILQEKNIHVWDGNTTREFLDKRGLNHYEEGDLGQTYGFNFRHFGGEYKGCSFDYGTGFNSFGENPIYSFRIPGETSFYVIGSNFTEYNGVSANNIIKLNSDGTVDYSFTGGTGFDGGVASSSCVIWTDKLLMMGGFTSYDGVPSIYNIILNSDGTIFQTFIPEYYILFVRFSVISVMCVCHVVLSFQRFLHKYCH